MIDKSYASTAATNPRAGSTVNVETAKPLAYFSTETGEFICIPPADAANFRQHHIQLSEYIRDYQSANAAIFELETRLEAMASHEEKIKFSVPVYIRDETADLLRDAMKWRDDANEKLRNELKLLSGSDEIAKGTGKKLIELIPLMEKEGDKPVASGSKSEGPKLDGMSLTQSLKFSTAAGLKDHFTYPKNIPHKLVYAHSDKVKKEWPKIKNAETTKWSDVYKKDESGKRVLDSEKLKKYQKEQLKSAAKIQSKDFIKIEQYVSESLLGDWGKAWEVEHSHKKNGSVSINNAHVADIDLSAKASLMRYLYGGSLNATFDPFKAGVSFRAEGHAAVSLAEAKAQADIFLPSKDGVLLCVYDIARTEYPLGAIRLQAGIMVRGLVGASIAAEVMLGVEMVDRELPKAKGRPGKRRNKREKTAFINPLTTPDNKAGLNAELNVFAGIKADVTLKGALQWRNPNNKDKKFEDFASVAPGLGGMAGLAASGKLQIDYVDGVFKISVHASLCIGLGAEGGVDFVVSAKQLGSFAMWGFFQIGNANYSNLRIFTSEGFDAFARAHAMAIVYGASFADAVKELGASYSLVYMALVAELNSAQERKKLAERILKQSNNELLHTPPESKGMLIYLLSRHGAVSDLMANGPGMGDQYLPLQRLAILKILCFALTKSDIKNIIQHIGKDGEKGNYEKNHKELNDFFNLISFGGANGNTIYHKLYEELNEFLNKNKVVGFCERDLSISGRGSDFSFNRWFDAKLLKLKDELARGRAVSANNTADYDLQNPSDHTMFASRGDAYYYTA